jgi:MFS family permease
MDFACVSDTKIGYIGSSFFLGWVITLLILPRIADLYGRKWLFRGGMIVESAAYTGIMLTTDINMLIACIFTVGMASTCRC